MAVNLETEKRLIKGAWDQSVEALTNKNWEARLHVGGRATITLIRQTTSGRRG